MSEQVLIHSKVAQLERTVLPFLRMLKDNEIERYNRLQIALSKLRDDFLPDYKFSSKNCWGDADNEIRHNIKFLCGKIKCEIRESSDSTYAVYKLTDTGTDDADRYLNFLSDEKRKKLERVANCVINHPSGKSLSSFQTCINKI